MTEPDITRPSMKAIIKALRQIITEDGDLPTREFVRQQVSDMVQRNAEKTIAGSDEVDAMVARAVKQTVLRQIGELGWGQQTRDTVDGRKAASKVFDDYVKKIVVKTVKAEIERIVLEALSVDIEIKGSVHRPASAARALKLEN